MGSHNDAVFNFEFDRSFSALSNNRKDVEMTCWSIMLYIFVYLFVLASALCSFLSLCYRNFLFRHLVVSLCSILGLSDTWGVTVGISALGLDSRLNIV